MVFAALNVIAVTAIVSGCVSLSGATGRGPTTTTDAGRFAGSSCRAAGGPLA